jgi:hypothetical protein
MCEPRCSAGKSTNAFIFGTSVPAVPVRFILTGFFTPVTPTLVNLKEPNAGPACISGYAIFPEHATHFFSISLSISCFN